MDSTDRENFIALCLRYLEGAALPTPLPANIGEYEEWRQRAMVPVELDEDVEDAWADLYTLVDEEPSIAWELLREIAARCRTDLECSTLSAGPLENFVEKYGNEFRHQIEEERARNDGFNSAYKWLRYGLS